MALSKSDKFRPWFRQLEDELLNVGLEVLCTTTGEHVESGAEDREDDDIQAEQLVAERRQRDIGPASYEAEKMANMQRLGGRLGKLVELMQRDIMPRFPSDPEALFLASSADFISRKWESALRGMQTSMAATHEGHCTSRELAARHYFVACIAMKIFHESNENK